MAQASIITQQPSPMGYLASTESKNITKAQEELLLWHSTLGHYNMANTQKLMTAVGVDKEHLLPFKEPGASTCSLPLCTACLRGKGGITPIGSKTSVPNPKHSDVIKEGDSMP